MLNPAIISLLLLNATWGFYAHKRINRLAVFTLPKEMFAFYKHNIQFITESAVNADRRRYAVEEEAARHYIDLDIYGDSAINTMPRYWNEAVEIYGEDTLKKYGIVPWHINKVQYRLTDAMQIGNREAILRLSADLGHYVADANVPLHTTVNYNGQLTGQRGIHGLWESRLPELFSENYNFFVGQAEYVDNIQLAVWEAVTIAHKAVDSVLNLEKAATLNHGEDKKYSYETRGKVTVKVYSVEYSDSYHNKLNGMVERQMRKSVKMLGDLWYTCWVNAGQPNLQNLIDNQLTQEELEERTKNLQEWKKELFKSREHEHK